MHLAVAHRAAMQHGTIRIHGIQLAVANDDVEIIAMVGMKAGALARRKPQIPHPNAIVFEKDL